MSNFDEETTTETDLIKHFLKFGIVTTCKMLTIPISTSDFYLQKSMIKAALVGFKTAEMASNAVIGSYTSSFKGTQVIFAEPAS